MTEILSGWLFDDVTGGGDADLQFRRDPPTYPIYNRVFLMGWLRTLSLLVMLA